MIQVSIVGTPTPDSLPVLAADDVPAGRDADVVAARLLVLVLLVPVVRAAGQVLVKLIPALPGHQLPAANQRRVL